MWKTFAFFDKTTINEKNLNDLLDVKIISKFLRKLMFLVQHLVEDNQ